MPYILEMELEYQDLVSDIIGRAPFECSEDFALLNQSLSFLAEEKYPDSIDNKFNEIYTDLKDVLEDFEFYATENIINVTRTRQDKHSYSKQEVVLAFSSDTDNPELRLQQAKIEYKNVIQKAIVSNLHDLNAKTESEKIEYINQQIQLKAEAHARKKVLYAEQIQIALTNEDERYAIRHYIYCKDDFSIRSHRQRALEIRSPGLGDLTLEEREEEYQRFLSFLTPASFDVEIIFRAIEIFPSHRDDIYNVIHFIIDQTALSSYHATLLNMIFPSKRFEREYSRTADNLPSSIISTSREFSEIDLNRTSLITYTVLDDVRTGSPKTGSVDDNHFNYTLRDRLFTIPMAPLTLNDTEEHGNGERRPSIQF